MPLPPIKEMIGVDLSGYIPAPVTPPPNFQAEQSLLPARSPLLRATAIYIPGTFPSSDSLTGYHIGGVIPQFRSPLPPPASAQGAGSTTNINANINASNSTSNVTITSNLGVIQSASFNIQPLNPGQTYAGSVTMVGEGWLFYALSPTFLMRVRGYGCSAGQASDLARPITQGPGFGTEQDIIFDVVMDTTLGWDFTPGVVGTNQVEGESQLLFVTVDNVSSSSQNAGSVSIKYAPIAAFKDQI